MAKRKRKLKKKVVTCTKIERVVEKFLEELQADYKHDYPIDRYRVDFLVNKKCIIECYGDYFHCNPTFYESSYFNKALGCLAQDKWSKDANRQHILEGLGYQFIPIWETDIKKRPKVVKAILKTIINQ